jgi:preprotein translocase subunit Sec63
MSAFTRAIDLIKEHFNEDWLTDSQRSTLKQVQDARGPGRGAILNVYGDFGVGKTFLGWLLARSWNCGYYKSFKGVPIGAEVAILDDFESSREFTRRILNQMKIQGIEQIVALSDKRVEDDVWAIQLELTQEDVAIARSNLFKIDLFVPERKYDTLWELVRACEVIQ